MAYSKRKARRRPKRVKGSHPVVTVTSWLEFYALIAARQKEDFSRFRVGIYP